MIAAIHHVLMAVALFAGVTVLREAVASPRARAVLRELLIGQED